MPAHQLTFGPVVPRELDQDVHVIGEKLTTVVDLKCPDCGAMLFVYYRMVPGLADMVEVEKDEINDG